MVCVEGQGMARRVMIWLCFMVAPARLMWIKMAHPNLCHLIHQGSQYPEINIIFPFPLTRGSSRHKLGQSIGLS